MTKLHPSASADDLAALFASLGLAVEAATVLRSPGGASRCSGFVKLEGARSAVWALHNVKRMRVHRGGVTAPHEFLAVRPAI